MNILPKLRTGLLFASRKDAKGETTFEVRHPVTGDLFEFGEMEYFLLKSLDGSKNRESIITDLAQIYKVELAPADFDAFIAGLAEQDLLCTETTLPHVTPSMSIPGVDAMVDEALAEFESDYQTEPHLHKRKIAETSSNESQDTIIQTESWARGPDPQINTSRQHGNTQGHGRSQSGFSLLKSPLYYWRIFQTEWFFKHISSRVNIFKYLGYLTPILLVCAILILIQNWFLVNLDIIRFWGKWSLLAHLFFSLLTVNLAVKFLTGVIASSLEARAEGLGIALVFGLIPRFHVEITGEQGLPKKKRLMLYASPLLISLLLFSLSTILWFIFRTSGTNLAFFCFSLAFVSFISFALAANPLGRGYGYALISTWLDVPDFRIKAFRSLLGIFLPKRFFRDDTESSKIFALRVYAFASIFYILLLLSIFLFFSGTWLEKNFQGTGVVIFLLLTSIVGAQWYTKNRIMREALNKAAKINPASPRSGESTRNNHIGLRYFATLALFIFLGLLIPYPYETGGPLEVVPIYIQKIHAEIKGQIESIDVDPNQWVPPGTVLGRIANYRQAQDVQITKALIKKQEAVLSQLLTTPREAELRLTERQYQAALVEERFSIEQLSRQEKLKRDGHTTQEDYDNARRRAETATEDALEADAKLDLVREGPHPQEILAARAELERLNQLLVLNQELLARTRFINSIAGRITNLELQNLTGSFLDEGDLFAEIIDDSRLKVYISIPETELSLISIGSPARLKFWAFPNRILHGSVAAMEPLAVEAEYGRVASAVVYLPNDQGELRAGMTGHGKVLVGRQPILVAFTHALIRFIQIEIWSWLP